MKKQAKKTLCTTVVMIGLFLIVGIIGGVDTGKPLSNVVWCFPILSAMIAAVLIGKLWDGD